MKKFVWAILIILLVNSWMYYKDYFDWQARLYVIWDFMTHLDIRVLDNRSLAMRQARMVVNAEFINGHDTSLGPCLREKLIPNWSLDLVHNPKIESDYDRANQCQNFLTGKTKYLILYDTTGNFIDIRVRE